MDSLSSYQRDNLGEFSGQLFAMLIIASHLILHGPRPKGHGIISTIYAYLHFPVWFRIGHITVDRVTFEYKI